MKKNLFLVAMTAIMLSSCGTHKQASSTYNQSLYNGNNAQQAQKVTRTQREMNKCEKLAYQRDFAAVGYGRGFEYDVARDNAAENARTELALMIETAVEGASQSYQGNIRKDGKATTEASTKRIVNQFMDEAVRYSKIIDSDAYDRSDGTIEVYVCVEINPKFNPAEKLTDIADNVLSNDDKLEVEFNKEQFKKEMEEGLKEYKERHRK